MDIYEDEEGLVVIADVPGVAADGLDVRVDRGVLTIQGQASHLAAGEPLEREYALTGFFRRFQLPEQVDSGDISAELMHGVLTVRLPRVEQAKPQRITVRTS